MDIVSVSVASTIAALGAVIWRKVKSRYNARERYIREYEFPGNLRKALKGTYPTIDECCYQVVVEGLRNYFLMYLNAHGRLIMMPSKVVDVLWHEFILDTRAYHEFSDKAFGGYFHHIPADKNESNDSNDRAMRRTWRLACQLQGIDPIFAARLPLLFAIDATLEIGDGKRYNLDSIKKQVAQSGGGACGGGGDGCCGGGGD